MPNQLDGATAPAVGVEKCILCGQNHKPEKQEELPTKEFSRDDDSLTANGRIYIKGDEGRSRHYPQDENGKFVSPLAPAEWSADVIFKRYRRGGKLIARAEKYQLPPIKGYIAAPHHMVALCCMNGKNGLTMPKVNAWVNKSGYDINSGRNCIFLPSSATQFFVAYYYAKVRGTGTPLQGHIGAHRKVYFQTVWDFLERIPRILFSAGKCKDTSTEEEIKKLAAEIERIVHTYEDFFFQKLAARKPEDKFRLGAQSYIEIPDEDEPFAVPAGVHDVREKYEPRPEDVIARLSYEILPEADS